MAQTNESDYGFSLNAAQAGQKAGLDFDHVESFAAEGAVFFGAGVVAGTDPEKQVAVAAADTESFVGISLFTHKQEQGIDQGASMGAQYSTGAEYRDKDTVNVLRRGRVYVEVTAEVAAGEDAYVDVATEGEEGKFTNVDTANLATGGTFRSGADVGELAIVEINLP